MIEKLLERQFLKKFNKFKQNVINYESTHPEKIEEEIDCSDYDEIEPYINKLISNFLFKNIYAKIICKNLSEIINYSYNHFWLNRNIINKQKEFSKNFYEAMINYRKPKRTLSIIYNEAGPLIYNNNSVKEMFEKKEFIDHILNLRLKPDQYEKYINNISEEKQKYFIDKSIEMKVPIPHNAYSINYYKGNNYNYIQERILDIIKYDNCFSIKTFCKDPKTLNEINNFLDQSPDIVFKSIKEITDYFLKRQEFIKNGYIKKKEIDTTNINYIIEQLLKEIIKYDNTPPSEIDHTYGGYSIVFMTNTKVLKIGDTRETEKFPDNPYIVKPLIRRTISNNNDESYFIEVTEKVQKLNNGEISEEDIYQLYKNLRDLGIVWTDTEAKNMGKLIKDNIIHWDKTLSDESTKQNFDGKRGDFVLKKGDFVLLDADYLFKVGDNNILYPNGSRAKEFEERYKKEKEINKDDNNENYLKNESKKQKTI